jgi:putative oxidoreductase
MSANTIETRDAPTGLAGLIAAIIRLYERVIPYDLIALLARFIIGMVFWLSGMTKIDGFSVKSSTFFLFANEYKVPLIPPDIAAYLATATEITGPLLLWVGLASRFAATAMLGMTLVIEIFVFPEAYVTHGQWAIGLLFIMAYGPGTFSLDHLIRRRYMGTD